LVESFLALLKIGAVFVATNQFMKPKELKEFAEVTGANILIADGEILEEGDVANFEKVIVNGTTHLKGVNLFHKEDIVSRASEELLVCQTQASDVAAIFLTSGSTGIPKGCITDHSAILSPSYVMLYYMLNATAEDIFMWGGKEAAPSLGIQLSIVWPFLVHGTSVLINNPTPENLIKVISKHKVTIMDMGHLVILPFFNQYNKPPH